MSLALARKYRPSTFDDLVGQETVSNTLSLALDSNRLSHAYLFSGLRGSGKTSTARIFAKALLCETRSSANPCNECTHCSMANSGSHMDIIEMDGASNRGIDAIKELIEHTKYKPSSAKYKIFIIDEVHMLTKEAFNALLKTLEEPPEFIKFILATTDPLKLPSTILSRTQHFRFKKISHNAVLKHLEYILNIEQIEYELDALEIIARSGAGSLRDSLTLLDQAIVYSKNFVDVATVTGMLGIIEPSKLEELLEDITNKDTDKVLKFIKLSSDFEAEMIIDELILYLKDLLLNGSTTIKPMIIERFFRVLAESKSLLSIGSDGEFVLSLMCFKMMESLDIKDIDSMIKSLEGELKHVEPEVTTTQTPLPALTEKQVETNEENNTPRVEPVKVDDSKFVDLIKKIYDRNHELGSCFEANIIFESYVDNNLTWESEANEEEKKLLTTHWGIIRTFVQDIFGFETKIINKPKKKIEPEPTIEEPQPEIVNTDEVKSSCIAPEAGDVEAAKEKESSNILDEPMIQAAIASLNPKKVRIKRNV